jgi:hypothetical protein
LSQFAELTYGASPRAYGCVHLEYITGCFHERIDGEQ